MTFRVNTTDWKFPRPVMAQRQRQATAAPWRLRGVDRRAHDALATCDCVILLVQRLHPSSPALVQFRTGPKSDGILKAHSPTHHRHRAVVCACTRTSASTFCSSALFRQSSPSAWCETALAPASPSDFIVFVPAGLIAEYPNKSVQKTRSSHEADSASSRD